MKLTYALFMLAGALCLDACIPAAEHQVASTDPTLEQVTPASSKLVKLVESTPEFTKTSFVVLSAGTSQRWSSAFRLLCDDCTKGLGAFGYSEISGEWAPAYATEAALRADNQVAASVPIVDLDLDGRSGAPVLASYRVVGATQANDPRYLVRLRADPDRLYEATCENFFSLTSGLLGTIPVSTDLLDVWEVAGEHPKIGCQAASGRGLPRPAPAPQVSSPLDVATVTGAWVVRRPHEGVTASTYPYVVTRAADGRLRGFAVDCGAEASSVLAALGLDEQDVRATSPSEQELRSTGFGDQPVIRCPKGEDTGVRAIGSSNDAARTLRFQFPQQKQLIEFTCRDAEQYWSARATSLVEVPYQALVHWNAPSRAEPTEIHRIGCRITRTWVVDYLRRITARSFLTGLDESEPQASSPAEAARRISGETPAIWSRTITRASEAAAMWERGSLIRLHAAPRCPPNVVPCDALQTTPLSEPHWRELITDGSDANLAWKAILDGYAEILQPLEDAGIPVIVSLLWDINAPTGAWWAGRPGPEGSLKLYQLSREYLVRTKGLSNVVWEWTTVDASAPESLASFYPGPEHVDVVAFSPWTQEAFPSDDYYLELRNIAADKPLALVDVLKLPSVAELSDQVGWSYVTAYGATLTTRNREAEIKAFFSNARALSEAELPLPGRVRIPPREPDLARGRPVLEVDLTTEVNRSLVTAALADGLLTAIQPRKVPSTQAELAAVSRYPYTLKQSSTNSVTDGWGTTGSLSMPQWLFAVDLGAETPISRVRLEWRELAWDKSAFFAIEVLEDTASTLGKAVAFGPPSGLSQLVTFPAVRTRYLMVRTYGWTPSILEVVVPP